jgi:hypothetical protein
MRHSWILLVLEKELFSNLLFGELLFDRAGLETLER